jgi:CDP-paratose 2-epimerase
MRAAAGMCNFDPATGREVLMHAVVTGGAGFIGSHLARRWAAAGHSVLIIDDLSRPGSRLGLEELATLPGLAVEVGDIRDTGLVERVMGGRPPDVVAHLAAQTAATGSLADPRADFTVNALGTLNVLDAVRHFAPEAIVLFASTNKVYGDLAAVPTRQEATRWSLVGRTAFAEDQPVLPMTPYGCSKATADLYVREYAATYGVRGVVLRQSCVYGPYTQASQDQGWVGWLVEQVVLGRPVTVFGDGRQVRDVLWIEDLLDLYDLLVSRPVEPGEVFNVGGGPNAGISVWCEFSALLEEVLGRPAPPPIFAPWRVADQRHYVSDLTKVHAALGWEPAWSLRAGLAQLTADIALTVSATEDVDA